MGYSNSSSEQVEYLKLNAATSETETPFFTLQRKKDGKWSSEGAFNQISGYIVGLSRREGEYNGQPIYTVRIRFRDDTETQKLFQVEATYNGLSYSILNTLMNVEPGEAIMIRVYARPSKTNGKFYPAAYIETSGKRVDWYYKLEDIPRPVTQVVGKKTVTDDSEVVDFYTGVIDKLIEKFGSLDSKSKAFEQESHPEPEPSSEKRPLTAKEVAQQEANKRIDRINKLAEENIGSVQEYDPLAANNDDDLPW